MDTYRIVRYYFNTAHYKNRTVLRGLTLEQAQEHCSDPETSSQTCKKRPGKERTRLRGPWFEGYTKE